MRLGAHLAHTFQNGWTDLSWYMEMDLHPCVSYSKDMEAEKTPFLNSGPQTDVMIDDVMGPWLLSSLIMELTGNLSC